MRVHKEGRKVVFTTFATVLVLIGISLWLIPSVGWAAALSAVFALAGLFVLRFFRNPQRELVQEEGAVFSPADGTVVAVERVFEPEYLQCECIQVSVFMSVWNVHANWYPVGGTIEYFRHHHGRFLVAWHPKSSTENERTTTVIDAGGGRKILFRQIAGAVARRIVNYSKPGRIVGQNSPCGFIKFGSRVDVFLPLDAQVKVDLNEKVTGSQTVLATFGE